MSAVVVSILCSLHVSVSHSISCQPQFLQGQLSLAHALSLRLFLAVQNAILHPSGWGWCEGLALGYIHGTGPGSTGCGRSVECGGVRMASGRQVVGLYS